MKTTAFLTFTGSGTVMKIWLTQLLTAGAAAPELLLLVVAVAGLGLQTLHSDQSRDRAERDPTPESRAPAADTVVPTGLEALSRA
jgi:hypothetical protein